MDTHTSQDYHGCKHLRVGSPHRPSSEAGRLAKLKAGNFFPLKGAGSSTGSPSHFSRGIYRHTRPDTFEQYNDRGIHQSPGGHKIKAPHEGGTQLAVLGRKTPALHFSHPHKGYGQRVGRPSKPQTTRSCGMGVEPTDFFGSHSEVGVAGCRFVRHSEKQEGNKLLFPQQRRGFTRVRLPGVSLALQP